MQVQPKDILDLVTALRQQDDDSQQPEQFWKPGKKYFIRTVTHHHTGVLVAVTKHEILLEKAAWIPSDGRLTDVLKNGNFEEVEMFPPGAIVAIGRGSLIDAVEISTIPTSQK